MPVNPSTQKSDRIKTGHQEVKATWITQEDEANLGYIVKLGL